MMPKSNFPYEAIAVIGKVLDDNEAKHGNHAKWRGISSRIHAEHAYQHLIANDCFDQSEDHLAHALVRLAMAVCVRVDG